jgi:hypothetical protein
MTLVLAGNICVAQEPGWWTALKAKCGMSPSMAYNDWVAQGSPCKSNQSTAATTPAAGSTAGQAFINGFQRGLANVQALQAQMLKAVTSANAAAGAIDAAKANTDEQQENAIMAAELARHQAAGQGTTATDFQNQYNSANQLLGGGLVSAALLPGADSGLQGSAPQQQAWQQLHCMAFLSGIAFDDLALGDIADYHDIRAEAAKAADGSKTGAACPQAPAFPDLRALNKSLLGAATRRLKSDMEQADQIAARLQRANYRPSVPTVTAPADNPQLAALMKQQQALGAVQSAENPYSDPKQFAQFEKDRQTLAQDIQDSGKIEKKDFGSLGVDLGTVPAPLSQASSPAK